MIGLMFEYAKEASRQAGLGHRRCLRQRMLVQYIITNYRFIIDYRALINIIVICDQAPSW